MNHKAHTVTSLLVGAPLLYGLGAQTPLAWVASLALFALGGQAPDYLEISYRDPNGYRGYSRVIAHRTLTHWPWPWVGALLGVNQLPPELAPAPVVAQLLSAWLGGALLHLLCDVFSPTGIPLLTPFGKRSALVLYRTGALSQWAVTAGLALIAWAGLALAEPEAVQGLITQVGRWV